MSKAREKDTGKFAGQAAMDGHPNIDKLDLTRNTKPATTSFQRGTLGPETGRARQNMPAEARGPIVPTSGTQAGPTVAPSGTVPNDNN